MQRINYFVDLFSPMYYNIDNISLFERTFFMNYLEKYHHWLSYENIDTELKEDLLSVANDENEIKERFAVDMSFGTAGLRGIISAGTNRMNIYTVRRATQGLALYLLDQTIENPSVAIAYDSRHKSAEFAKEAARVLAGSGITAYLFDELKPTPELSFAVRHLGASAGIVVTASHNPAKYNGYKVYGDDGCQIGPVEAEAITAKINSLDFFEGIKMADDNSDLIISIGREIEEAFLQNVQAQQINPDAVKKAADDFKVVYTPFHGTGNKPVQEIFRRIGLVNVYPVEAQCVPDGAFPTVKSPNPEDKEGFCLAIELAKEKQSDLIIGTDPDCDRVGVIIRDKNGEFVPLTGNQIGALLCEYILSQRTAKGTMPKNPFVIKTIVTTQIIKAIAENYNATMFECLTGFKFIGELIRNNDENGNMSYVFGFEESYGYLAGTYARDKDAVVASMLIAEMAAFYSLQDKTLYDALQDLYVKYGYYHESTKSIFKEGLDGAEQIVKMMSNVRANIPTAIAGLNVLAYRDYQTGLRHDMTTGNEQAVRLPKSNVVYFELENDNWLVLRPSGTEPKIKLYAGIKAESKQTAQELADKLICAGERLFG